MRKFDTVPRIALFFFLTVLALVLTAMDAAANIRREVADQCDAAARDAAREFNIPSEILFALTRTETGRTVQSESLPWPWAINMAGNSKWFPSREDAVRFVQARYDGGAANLDIGCFQLNVRWHGENFASIDAMFSPRENARYAAKFLDTLYAEFGSWRDAVGAYHSRTPQFANRYKRRFDDHLAQLDPGGLDNATPLRQARLRTEPRTGLFSVNGAGPDRQSRAHVLGSLLPVRTGGDAAKRLF